MVIHSFIYLFSSCHFDRACLSRRANSAVLFSTRDLEAEISTSTSGDFECPLRRGVPHLVRIISISSIKRKRSQLWVAQRRRRLHRGGRSAERIWLFQEVRREGFATEIWCGGLELPNRNFCGILETSRSRIYRRIDLPSSVVSQAQ